MHVLLISTYELGHQPFGLASPAAWLRQAGVDVTCLDVSVQPLSAAAVTGASLIGFYLPMHTATRLAADLIPRVRRLNPQVHLCCFGLYAPVNESYLRGLGVHTILGGEFEAGLVDLVQHLAAGKSPAGETISLTRQRFQLPDRADLPPLTQYAWLDVGDGTRRTVGYTEATRGCRHLCRHCPVVPVYNGRFFVVQPEIVLADVRQQVAAGAQHITFGDPDFFNGPGHALRIVQSLHDEFPHLTYDVTIKIEHLLRHARHLPTLQQSGCLFVTSAVEAVDDQILVIFDKGHTRADFIEAATLLRQAGLSLNPTFVSFTPWTTLAGYVDFLALIHQLGLVSHISPIQYAIRLLIPAGSRLLELPQTHQFIGPFDEAALAYPWRHPQPAVDRLYEQAFDLVKAYQRQKETRHAMFAKVWSLATAAAGDNRPWPYAGDEPGLINGAQTAVAAPVLSEPWY